jgi:hypothetical protein
MKKMLKLTVLLTTLLLLTGVSFAEPQCDCYEVTYTNLDDPTQVPPEPSSVRICYSGYPVGTVEGLCSQPPYQDPLFMFFDSMNEQALTSRESCVAYLKFHGDDQYVLTGLTFGGVYRYTIRGHKVDESECIDE